jgi:hypothetical protein
VKENDMKERSTARAALCLIPALALAACTGSASNSNAKPGDGGTTSKLDGGKGDSAGGGGPVGGSAIKFCNALAREGNANLRLILKVGDPPVELIADSGGCSTTANAACKTVAPGMALMVNITDDMDMPFATGMIDIAADKQYVMVATLDDTTGKPTVEGGSLKPGFSCAMFDPFMPGPAPDAGASD